MNLIFNFFKKIFFTVNNQLNYYYFASLLKREFIKNINIDKKNQKSLVGIIDNISYAPTFIVLEFLIYLKSLNFKNNYIIILPFEKKKETLYKKNDNFISSGNDLRYKTILEPSLDLIKDFNKNIIFLSDRYKGYNFLNKKNTQDLILPKKTDIFTISKEDYNFTYLKRYLENFKKNKKRVLLESPKFMKEFVKKYINYKEKEKIISISLKDANYQSLRNSNNKEWFKLANYLKNLGYRVIFISDITTLDKKKNFIVQEMYNYENYDIFSFDIRARLALYEICFLNFSVSSGTNVLLFHSKANYLIHSVTNHKIKYGTGSYKVWYKHTGISHNKQFPFATDFQKIIWEKDNENFSCMKKEFINFQKIFYETFKNNKK